jgi:hypothetical protein
MKALLCLSFTFGAKATPFHVLFLYSLPVISILYDNVSSSAQFLVLNMLSVSTFCSSSPNVTKESLMSHLFCLEVLRGLLLHQTPKKAAFVGVLTLIYSYICYQSYDTS